MTDPIINEFVFNHRSTDTNEFIEVLAGPNADLSRFTILVVEGSGSNPGRIDRFYNLDSADANGYWTTGFLNNELENDTQTLLLVEDFTGNVGDDIDDSNNGTIDNAPWGRIVDSVAVRDGDTTDPVYTTAVLDQGFDDLNPFTVGGASRIPDGTDTDTAGDWVRNDFDREGLPGFTGTPEADEAVNTPGAENQAVSGTLVPIPLAIYEIQGAGHISDYNGNLVTTTGIVTAVDNNGFFIQDANGDGDDATSDGIFVSTGFGNTGGVVAGNEVTVTGFVEERFPFGTGNLSTTRIVDNGGDNIEIALDELGVPIVRDLPDAVILGRNGRTPPTEIIEDLEFQGNPEVFAETFAEYSAGANGSFGDFDITTDALDFYESVEGMRVTVEDAIAVSGSNRFGEVFVAADNGADVTGGNDRGGVTIATDAARSDFNPERIQIDPDSTISGFGLPNIDTGDTLGDVTGVVGYAFGNFELIPTEDFRGQVEASNLDVESTELEGDDDELSVATYNVLNLDPNDADGDMDFANGRFDAIAGHIVDNLNRPDIIALQEVQDNNGSAGGGITAADVTLQTLVDAIIAAGGPVYSFIDNPGVVDGAGGGQPGGNIRTAFLYNDDRVDLIGGSVRAITDPDLSDGDAFQASRLPLQATFTFDDQDVTIINVHSSSKGGSSPLFGGIQPPINGGSELERVPQSEVIKGEVDAILADDADANVIVMGDFNEFDFNESVQVLVDDGTLNNLTEELAFEDRYTFNFRGNAQSLDHILVTDGLNGEAEVDIVHVNTEFAETSGRASDHDPMVALFDFDNLDDDDDDDDDIAWLLEPAGPEGGPSDGAPERPDDTGLDLGLLGVAIEEDDALV